MTLSVKDRVFAAAEQISAERRPTVSTVRAAAGVSNADATRYLKEWTEEKHAAGGQLAAAPAALLEQAARLAGACWAEASGLADERHAGLQTAWAQEKKDLNLEIAELVADLDKVSAEKDSAVTELTARITALEAQLAATGEQFALAQTAAQDATREAAAALTRLAAAEARTSTLQEAHDALLQRITPQTPAEPKQVTGGEV
ncbi:DNA-binding protein [Arthrobacter sp. U41]|uniref:DNA-binding protein n=1 Tax=Arthrobacter sp. U41 TaxID=1849032 RepID=UPI0008595F9C|nr:DNA-binding protein [Arthrobacter sp. U41]AOT05921.1 KfrA protein [Arthrobacter sp. U41]